MELKLSWMKCKGSPNAVWCGLLMVNLSDLETEGVYIVWHGGEKPRVVYVGQGVVADRLTQHRKDKRILAYKEQVLYVTWAAVGASYRDGVERYLADYWNPLVGEAHPDATPIAVNSPWS